MIWTRQWMYEAFTRKPLKTIAFILVIAGLIPLPYPLCPDWVVTVVDKSGAPVPGMTVTQYCADYSAFGRRTESDTTTDQHGKVFFKIVRNYSPVLLRLIGNSLNLAEGVHASFGRHSHVSAFDKYTWVGDPVTSDGYIEDWTGSPLHMESEIVLEK